MFTEKDLVAGETVLVWNAYEKDKVKYLGKAGLIHFVSHTNKYSNAGIYYTIEELNKYFNIEQPKSNAVPLEKKVYDFVPVRCRDNDNSEWVNFILVAVCDYNKGGYPYTVIDEDGYSFVFRYCEFLNEQ
jgi:hypothetical protein